MSMAFVPEPFVARGKIAESGETFHPRLQTDYGNFGTEDTEGRSFAYVTLKPAATSIRTARCDPCQNSLKIASTSRVSGSRLNGWR